jgi:hypothetical protein
VPSSHFFEVVRTEALLALAALIMLVPFVTDGWYGSLMVMAARWCAHEGPSIAGFART